MEAMATVKDTISRVRAYVAAGHATRSGLAVSAGLTVTALRGLASAASNPAAAPPSHLDPAIPARFLPPGWAVWGCASSALSG